MSHNNWLSSISNLPPFYDVEETHKKKKEGERPFKATEVTLPQPPSISIKKKKKTVPTITAKKRFEVGTLILYTI